MPKKRNDKGETPEDKDSKGKKGDTKFDKIKRKAKKSKRKKVKVNLPMLYSGSSKSDAEFANYTQEPDEPPQKSEYEIEYEDMLLAVEIEKLAAKGLNNDEIIENIGMSRATFYQRLRDEPYFSYALHKHRGVADLNVQNALYRNATGFKYTEQQGTAMGLVVTVEKYKVPETRAQEIYLYNRQKDEWRRKPEPTQQKGNSISHMGVIIKRRE